MVVLVNNPVQSHLLLKSNKIHKKWYKFKIIKKTYFVRKDKFSRDTMGQVNLSATLTLF